MFKLIYPFRYDLTLVFIEVLFGLSYIISKVLVREFHPVFWGVLRSASAAIVIAGVAILLRRPHPPLKKHFLFPMVLYAFLGGVLTPVAFLSGLHLTTSTNSAVLNTLIPVFAFCLGIFRGREVLSLSRVFGLLVAFLGVLVLCHVESFDATQSTWLGDLITLLNCLSYAIFLTYSKDHFQKYDRVWCTAWLFGVGTLGLLIFAIPYWHEFRWPIIDFELGVYIAYGVLGSTVAAYFLTVWVLTYVPSSKVAFFGYLQPIVTTVLAWVWLKQPLTARTCVSSLMIFVGIFFATQFHRLKVPIFFKKSAPSSV